ncbi:MAG: tetratricopeptide repeat protein, partial [Planctomycetaceae bacterium]|nr:tetratricopeptide repeat protein [Planctomycetaceae bacterium]
GRKRLQEDLAEKLTADASNSASDLAAELCETEGLMSAVDFHRHIIRRQLELRIEERRKTSESTSDPLVMHYELGQLLTRLGRWDEAETEFRTATTIAPDNQYPWLWTVPILVIREQDDEYRAFCHAIAEQFRDTTDVMQADVVCKTSLLRPGETDFADLPCQLVEDAAADPSQEGLQPWLQSCSSLIALRRGEFQLAIERSEQVPFHTVHAYVLARIIRSIALVHTNRLSEAIEQLQSVEGYLPPDLRALSTTPTDTPLILSEEAAHHDWQIPWILWREAKQLLQEHAPTEAQR